MIPLAYQDQENLVHGHQTAASLKPLNNGIRGLAPKTPGNNASKLTTLPLQSEKKTGTLNPGFREIAKDNENVHRGGKSVKVEKDGFVTPLARRIRAPLGAKTTNAKVTAFRTPAPLTQKTQLRSTSTRRAKLKIHRPKLEEPRETSADGGAEEPDIEYCPPRAIPLPDYLDEDEEWDRRDAFHMFEGRNKFRGWFSHFANPMDENGLSKWDREDQEQKIRMEKLTEEKIDASISQSLSDLSFLKANVGHARSSNSGSQRNLEKPKPSGDAGGKPKPPLKNLLPSASSSTMDPKTAAKALAPRSGPSFAEPTATSRAKRAANFQPGLPSMALNSGSLASRTTIGYAQGRVTSLALRSSKGKSYAMQESFERKEESIDSDEELLQEVLRDAKLDDNKCDDWHLSDSAAVDAFFLEKAREEFVLELPKY